MGRLIDADALIAKCGDWYCEEGLEEGFIGTVKQLIDEQPTVELEDNWIPCDEAVPTNSDRVLTTKKYPFGIYVEMDKYVNGQWIGEIPDEDCKTDCKTIAWMPLPPAYRPKEETE